MQLCDAFGLPIVSLVDTPGMMVGPKAEATGLVRHASRLLVAGAALRRAARRGRSCAAATASARRRWSAAACTSRC